MLVTMHRNIHTVSNSAQIKVQSLAKTLWKLLLQSRKFLFICQLDYYPLNIYMYGQAFLIKTAYGILNPENLLTMVMGRSTINGGVLVLHRKKKVLNTYAKGGKMIIPEQLQLLAC